MVLIIALAETGQVAHVSIEVTAGLGRRVADAAPGVGDGVAAARRVWAGDGVAGLAPITELKK
jgi:hypothetical protein